MSDQNTPADRKTARPGLTPRTLRDLHLYLAVFFAPSILFFALTGAVQLFGLHESHGTTYRPPSVIEKLSQVHIHQRYALKPVRPRPPAAKPTDAAASAAKSAPPKPQEKKASTLAIQIFFLGTAVGLTLASLLGLWIGLTQGRLRKVSAVLAVLGVIAPIVLVALG